MTPIEFSQVNTIFAKDQPGYQPLPACLTIEGVVITCWQLSAEEIKQMLETKCIWLRQLTFGQPLQPQLPSVETPFVPLESSLPE